MRAFNVAQGAVAARRRARRHGRTRGDWGQYGFLQLGDYAGARERIERSRRWPRPPSTRARSARWRWSKARYIIETEEWKVQPVAESASNETMLANGLSAVKTGDLATAEKMEALLAAKAQAAPAAPPAGGAHADHGAGAGSAPAPGGGPTPARACASCTSELAALDRLGEGPEGSGDRAAEGSGADRREHASAQRRRRSDQAVARAARRSAAAGRQAGRGGRSVRRSACCACRIARGR